MQKLIEFIKFEVLLLEIDDIINKLLQNGIDHTMNIIPTKNIWFNKY